IELQTMATSGIPLAVKESAGYVQTQSLNLYTPADSTSGTFEPSDTPAGGSAIVKPDDGGYLEVTQPTGWETDPPPDATAASNPWLTLHPPNGDTFINLSKPTTSGEKYAFLELELYNATQNNRGGDLYIQMQDKAGTTVF